MLKNEIKGNPLIACGHFLPSVDNTCDLGSVAKSWRNIYVDSLIYVTSTVMQGDFLPSADDTYDLGSSNEEWKDLHVDGTAYIDTLAAVTLGGTVTLNGQAFDAGSGYVEINTTGKVGLQMDGGITTGGSTPLGRTQHWFSGSFVSDGSSTFAWKQTYGGSLTGAAGDTTELIGSIFANTIATQTIVDESIGLIAQVEIDEPDITDNLSGTGEIIVAATLYVKAAPDKGLSNAAIWINAGDMKFAGEVESAAVADQVALGGFDVGIGERALAISQEAVVIVDTDETKFSHRMPVSINGTTYFMMLTQS